MLKEFSVSYEMKVLSAHRSPEDVTRFVKRAKARGFKVFICGAGGAAHLAGTVAAQTTLPVIGVPLNSSSLGGFDALLKAVAFERQRLVSFARRRNQSEFRLEREIDPTLVALHTDRAAPARRDPKSSL